MFRNGIVHNGYYKFSDENNVHRRLVECISYIDWDMELINIYHIDNNKLNNLITNLQLIPKDFNVMKSSMVHCVRIHHV